MSQGRGVLHGTEPSSSSEDGGPRGTASEAGRTEPRGSPNGDGGQALGSGGDREAAEGLTGTVLPERHEAGLTVTSVVWRKKTAQRRKPPARLRGGPVFLTKDTRRTDALRPAPALGKVPGDPQEAARDTAIAHAAGGTSLPPQPHTPRAAPQSLRVGWTSGRAQRPTTASGHRERSDSPVRARPPPLSAGSPGSRSQGGCQAGRHLPSPQRQERM